MVTRTRRIIQTFILDCGIPSENFLYRPRKFSKGFYKDPKVRAYQEQIIQKGLAFFEIRKILEKSSLCQADLFLDFFLKKSFWKRDVTNMVKATEDAISKISGLDDSLFRQVSSKKHSLPREINSEALIITISLEILD